MKIDARFPLAVLSFAGLIGMARATAFAATGPDLTPTLIKVFVAAEGNGCSASIQTRVKNIGNVNAGSYTIRFTVDGQAVDAAVPNGTNAGRISTEGVDVLVAPGSHSVSVFADVFDQVLETNEGNNSLGPKAFICR